MKYTGTLIAVNDIEKSKQFYHDVLGLDVVADFGANVTLTGGVVLQTLETWQSFIHTDDVTLKNNAGNSILKQRIWMPSLSIWSLLTSLMFTNCTNTLGDSGSFAFMTLTGILSRRRKNWMPSLHALLCRDCLRKKRQIEWVSRLTLWYQA